MNYRLPLFCLSLFALSASHGDTIYRCDLADGSVSLQRQRCGGQAEEKRYSFSEKIRSSNSRGPAELPDYSEPPARNRRRTTSRNTATPRRNPIGKQLTQCRKLWNREEDLRDAEREGYTAAEGEKNRREQQRIKRDKKLLRCDELD